MMRFKQFLLFEDATEMGGNFERKKRIVRPSSLSPDAAIRAFDLSQDFDPFAAFSDTKNMTDKEIVSAFEKNKVGMESPSLTRLNKRLEALSKEFTGENLTSEKAKDIRASLMQERLRLLSPNITIDDATKLKPPPHIRAAKGMTPDFIKLGWHNIGYWNNLTPNQRALFYKDDLRGVLQPEPFKAREDYLFKEVKIPSKYTPQAIKSTGKAVGKIALKMLPVVGTAASLAAMGQRAQAGDYVGAGLEAASEIADYIPGIGTAASLGIQGYLADRDMSDEERKEADQKRARQALRSINVHSPKY